MPRREHPRKIPAASFTVAALVIGLSVLAGGGSAREVRALGNGPLLQFAAAVFSFYAVALAGYRSFLWFFPLQEGPVVAGRTAFTYCTYMLLNIFVFFPVSQTSFILPFPFRRPLYQLLGAHLGRNTHCPGAIRDPPLVEIGDDVVIGSESLFFAHAAEASSFVLARIRVGHRATIGTRAVLMPGVTVGEDAIVAAGAIVTKYTHIGPKELWGGVPARLIKTLS
jgi:acetyltransferase-like isoleucine patch superfamily enzyme